VEEYEDEMIDEMVEISAEALASTYAVVAETTVL